MKVVISGANGFIGTALQAELERRGHTSVALTRSPGPGDIGWDPVAGRIDSASLEDADAVVHLAGEGIADSRWTEEQKRTILDSRTRGTTLLAETIAGLERRPSVFISGSAIGYYGDRGDEVLTEESPAGDDFLAGVCVAWEAATRPAADAGVRTCTIRTGIVLDAEGGALAKQLLPFKLGVGGRLGSGDQWQSWITLADHVAAICHLIETDVSGPVNVVAPNPVTNHEFTATLGRVLGRPTLLPIPTFAPALLYGRELVKSLLLVSQRVRPTVLLDSGFEFGHTHLEPALRAVLGRPERASDDRMVSVTRTIAASATDIFAVLTDPSQHARIDGSGSVTGSHDSDPEPLRLGSRFSMGMKIGVPYRMSNEVVEYEPDRLIAWTHFGGHRWRYQLQPVEGGTRVTETFDWSTSKAPWFIELLGWPRRHPPAMAATLERLDEVATNPAT
ncbi:MAG: TIGR01777 family oxidoreductase [Acidimicrobiia bacterium]|nr:TIGR01777 family oxidoreductase [Acidimicrobiia bacterium]